MLVSLVFLLLRRLVVVAVVVADEEFVLQVEANGSL